MNLTSWKRKGENRNNADCTKGAGFDKNDLCAYAK